MYVHLPCLSLYTSFSLWSRYSPPIQAAGWGGGRQLKTTAKKHWTSLQYYPSKVHIKVRYAPPPPPPRYHLWPAPASEPERAQSYIICVLGVRTPCGDTPAFQHENAPSRIDMTSCLANIFRRHFGGFFCRGEKIGSGHVSCKIDGWWWKRMGDKNYS
jgi:hypothetical protein